MTEFLLVVLILASLYSTLWFFEPAPDPLTPEQEQMIRVTANIREATERINAVTAQMRRLRAIVQEANESMREAQNGK